MVIIALSIPEIQVSDYSIMLWLVLNFDCWLYIYSILKHSWSISRLCTCRRNLRIWTLKVIRAQSCLIMSDSSTTTGRFYIRDNNTSISTINDKYVWCHSHGIIYNTQCLLAGEQLAYRQPTERKVLTYLLRRLLFKISFVMIRGESKVPWLPCSIWCEGVQLLCEPTYQNSGLSWSHMYQAVASLGNYSYWKLATTQVDA